eukprot:1159095-Pelagomonas_calceolata.AAC.1
MVVMNHGYMGCSVGGYHCWKATLCLVLQNVMLNVQGCQNLCNKGLVHLKANILRCECIRFCSPLLCCFRALRTWGDSGWFERVPTTWEPPPEFLDHLYITLNASSDSLAQYLSIGTLLVQLDERGSVCMTRSQSYARKGVGSMWRGSKGSANQTNFPDS